MLAQEIMISCYFKWYMWPVTEKTLSLKQVSSYYNNLKEIKVILNIWNIIITMCKLILVSQVSNVTIKQWF